MHVRFDPGADGAWLVRIAAGRVLAVEAGAAGEELADLLAAPDGFARVLDELLRRGITSAPSFALAESTGSGVRAVVRGDAVVASGGDEVSGAGVATWVERTLPGPAIRITAPGGTWTLEPDAGAVAAAAPPRTEVVESTVEPVEESIPAHEFLFAPPAEPASLAPVAPVASAPDGDHAGDTVLVADLPSAADHDGLTILQGDLPRAAPGDHDGSTVLAAEVAGLSTGVPAPARPAADAPLALELPDGRLEPLTQPVLLGRSPNLARSTGPLPRLLTVGGDDPDISRTHARVAVEGGTVLVTDLGSRNGTSVVIPGRAPQRLREHEPTAVLVGTVIDLGGGVILTVRED